jgi:hypothetical protein
VYNNTEVCTTVNVTGIVNSACCFFSWLLISGHRRRKPHCDTQFILNTYHSYCCKSEMTANAERLFVTLWQCEIIFLAYLCVRTTILTIDIWRFRFQFMISVHLLMIWSKQFNVCKKQQTAYRVWTYKRRYVRQDRILDLYSPHILHTCTVPHFAEFLYISAAVIWKAHLQMCVVIKLKEMF